MPGLLVITPYPNLSADTRYRVSQFIPSLQNQGWEVTVHSFMDEGLFRIYNIPGNSSEKIKRTAISLMGRFFDCVNARHYDAILLHKEAFPFGPPVIESILHKIKPKIIYDMDDAFWTHPPQIKQIGKKLRDPRRIEKMIRLSKQVLAGNEFLAAYAKQFNPSVTIFPTVLDTNRYLLRDEPMDEDITIGWVGRWSSSPYLTSLYPVFDRLSRQFPQVKLRIVGAGEVNLPKSIHCEIVPWRLETEIEDIAGFDIGIMPLADDIYSQGKCGFKLLQYMALGIPGVASPVGVNQKIVRNGVNGFLALREEEWIEKLSLLICDRDLRKQVGLKARRTVEEQYSLEKAIPVLVDILNQVVGQ